MLHFPFAAKKLFISSCDFLSWLFFPFCSDYHFLGNITEPDLLTSVFSLTGYGIKYGCHFYDFIRSGFTLQDVFMYIQKPLALLPT